MGRVNSLKTVLLIAAMTLFSAVAHAQSDSRMVVEITADEQGVMPTVKEAIQQALPILWDRLIEPEARASLSDNMRATPFVLRVLPQHDRIRVTFNQERVWQYLDEKNIAYRKEPPRFSLHTRMINSNGSDMPKTAEALQAYASGRAATYGVLIEPDAPSLTMKWQWLDRSRLYLKVEGDSALDGYSETRTLASEDALAQLESWVDALLTKMRDASQPNGEMVETDASATEPANELELRITIDQPSTLSAQVVLEEALRHEASVKSVIPVLLSANRRQYRILLHAPDDRWVAAWFRRRGMQAEPTPDGWLVH